MTLLSAVLLAATVLFPSFVKAQTSWTLFEGGSGSVTTVSDFATANPSVETPWSYWKNTNNNDAYALFTLYTTEGRAGTDGGWANNTTEYMYIAANGGVHMLGGQRPVVKFTAPAEGYYKADVILRRDAYNEGVWLSGKGDVWAYFKFIKNSDQIARTMNFDIEVSTDNLYNTAEAGTGNTVYFAAKSKTIWVHLLQGDVITFEVGVSNNKNGSSGTFWDLLKVTETDETSTAAAAADGGYVFDAYSTTNDATTLTAAITAAQTFIDEIVSNNLVSDEFEEPELGQYDYNAYITLYDLITAANEFLQTGPPYSYAEIEVKAAQINEALAALQAAYECEKNVLANGEYFMKVGGYYIDLDGWVKDNQPTNVSSGFLDENINISNASQLFRIAKLSGHTSTPDLVIERYSLFSVLDPGIHIADNGRLRNSWGTDDDNWRTVNILYDGEKYALQYISNGPSKGFLKTNDANNEVLVDNNPILDPSDFVFDLRSVAEVFNEQVAAGAALLAANANNIGNGSGQYLQSVYDDFQAVITSAQAIADPTKDDLFALGAALALFVPNQLTDDASILSAAIADAQAFIASITVVAEGVEPATGEYPYAAYKTLADLLTDGQAYINGNTIYDIVVMDAKVAAINAALDALKASFKYETNTLTNGEYFLKAGEYYINNVAAALSQPSKVDNGALTAGIYISDARQLFTVAKLSGYTPDLVIERYSIFSVLDPTCHLNESGSLRNNWGESDDDWRTFNILYNGTKYAVQCAGSSSNKGFWKVISDELKGDNDVNIDAGDFIFVLLTVPAVYNEQVAAGAALLAANANNIGDEDGQYSQQVYDDFQAMVTAAQTAEPTKENLFAYGAARAAFLPNGYTALPSISADKAKVIGLQGAIKIAADNARVSVYTITGARIAETAVSGEKTVPVARGIYLVKVNNQIAKVIVK
jgi:hypothetical protein